MDSSKQAEDSGEKSEQLVSPRLENEAPPEKRSPEHSPLSSLDEWEEDLLRRYPDSRSDASGVGLVSVGNDAADLAGKSSSSRPTFRDYDSEARPSVREFYRLNHRFQTYEFVQQKRKEYLGLNRQRMGIWEAMEFLNQLIDDSDPDLDLPQIEHLLQTAEAIRADGHPSWFVLAGLIHDLGKILCLWGEPQWAVVGDTFPVGCKYSESIVYYDFFRHNPDWSNELYQSRLGIYTEACGMDNLTLSWGHDEYLYHVTKEYLPAEALAMIRYHSCYPIHRERAYGYLLQDGDQELLSWVEKFNQYDLYTKRDERMDVAGLEPYYRELIGEYFPDQIRW
ncbi:MAG: inositol oxygenase family protein [Aureliella sp.]